MAARGVRHFVAATACVAVAAYVAIYAFSYADAPIRSDGYSYYVYLPATFIYGDPSLEALSHDWYGGAFPDFTAIRRYPSTGRWLDACPIGEALLILPFFIVGHVLSWWSNLPRDGFSFYYQHAAGLAGVAYFLAGLAIVRSMLRRRFSEGVVLATLVALTWGTNLFHYGTFDATFSHAFSFFLISGWIVLVDRWWERPTALLSLALGAVAGLIVLTRNLNAIFLAVLPLYGIVTWSDVGERIDTLWRRRVPLILAAAAALLLLLPQFVLYKWTTGSWIVNSYQLLSNRFAFGSPHVAAVLFSTQKGLFFWSPLLLLASVGGFVARGRTRRLVLAAAVIFVLQTYIVASWSDWQLGGSYGHRAFTDGLALAAPLIASFFEWAAARRRARTIVTAFAAVAVLLSVVQMIQYWNGIIPFADTTWAQYRSLFLRFR
jgi:hypothetical protein